MQPKNHVNVEELEKIWKMHANLSSNCECFHAFTLYKRKSELIGQKPVLLGPKNHLLVRFLSQLLAKKLRKKDLMCEI